MKRIIALLLTAVFLISMLCGCKKAESSKNGNTVMPGFIQTY